MIKKLYDDLQPTAYQLKLNVDSENLEFSGTVGVSAKLVKNSGTITLHAKELDVQACSINGQEVEFLLKSESDELVLAGQDTRAGDVEIAVEFKGKITDAMHGMYPCYFEHEGKRKHLIATQFESHHAREVFPCIDEPAAKATFDVELITSEGEQVLANMPVKDQQLESGRLITQFETTPVMSTYLLAFATGEMVSKEATTKDGVVVRSWAAAHHDPSWLDYSLSETVRLIEFYDEYFGVSYPLPKCDQIALPDFESGAMENWGLITYRETVFLSDPSNPSLGTMQWISLVIAHELSHQWFGNLVTMQWWDDLWLNESFANMTEYLAVDKLHPEWDIWEEFAASDVLSATNRDVYADVQPVRVEVSDPSVIGSLFDPSIVYAKGGKLLRMLMLLLGEESWRAGLKDYFEKHAYKNTVRDDLWAALNQHSDIDVPKLMNTWIERPGQPLVQVRQKSNAVELSQGRITLDETNDSTVWQVPLLADHVPILFTEKSTEIALENNNFIRLNLPGIGHYITNYTETDHKQYLAKLLADTNTDSTWKISRLNELIMLARHGDTDLTEALSSIVNCSEEERAMVWSLIAGILGNARMLTEGDEVSESTLKQISYSLAESSFKKLGWDYKESDDSNTTHLRTIILGLMMASENQTVIDEALARYRSADDAEKLPAESRSLILTAVSKFGTDTEFEELLKKHNQTQSPDYRSDLCAAITATKDHQKIAQLHKLMLDTTVVKPQDLRQWYVYLLRNRYGRASTWQWLVDNWGWIMENFGGSKTYDDFVRYSASFFSTQEQLDKYVKFFNDKKDDPALKRAIAIGTEEVKARVAWRTRDEAKVATWLKEYSAKNL